MNTVPQWQTMDSAPKDRYVLGLDPILKRPFVMLWNVPSAGFEASFVAGDETPTHWMNLPDLESQQQIEKTAKDNELAEKFVKYGPDLLRALKIIASQSVADDWTADQAMAFVKQHAREATHHFK